MYVLGLAAYVIGWLKGGSTERRAVGLLLVNDLIARFPVAGVRLADDSVFSAVDDAVLMLVFAWLAIRFARWWLLAATALLALTSVVHLLTLAGSLNLYASVSARIGLWSFLYLALLAGVWERWLAGEPPAAAAAVWRPRRADT